MNAFPLCVALLLPGLVLAAPPKKDDKPDPVAFIQKFDTNADHKLDATELSAGLKTLRQNRVTTKNDSWKKFDTDGDGKINLMELKKLFEENSREPVEAGAFMAQFDANKDGKLDSLEMSAAFRSLKPNALTSTRDFWKKFDTNFDGKLNAKEVEKLIEEYNGQ